ncbi:molecular chaperone GrpE [Thermosipho melanesiensis]|uniref:Protein GrpE n=2 Tax=Thermosipho melanesiensis TaxID=46541 RepID=A6LJ64_THEM4|nr:nucleotide exchange factor GrpE [Thermosipho melanesiensis]ABR29965.1 GrpE protein [Thermosipho melanesiensis BI429]APT73169.1 molecular chaperone GrpE [Thermosipho melanesiensis]OOC38566.1 molecular chaperone GrpE [Thermosipho melanesiensis]OOC40370.1 molecular chaperone GrpE [Thermosipho melanesiensis]OOC40634.1 molecular chaperone GrpE [Thermosipho melanesiensis]
MEKERKINNNNTEKIKKEETKKDERDVIKEQKERIVELEKQLVEIENYARMLKAQFENYKKDVVKGKEQIVVSTVGKILESFLPILDDFKRSFRNATEEEKEMHFYKAIEIVYKNFVKILNNFGLEEVKVGAKFDPFEHEAVERIEDEEKEEYSIVEVVEDGYKFKGRILKPAKVKVSVKPRR